MASIKFIHIPRTGGTSISKSIGIKVIGHWVYKRNFNEFSWCVFRNPIDRFISAFNHLKYNQINSRDRNDSETYIGDKDIHEFIEHGLNRAIKEQQHFLPQIHWIPLGVNQISLYENIQDDFMRLYNRELMWVNRSDKQENELSEREERIIKNYYKLDFFVYNGIKKYAKV